MELHDKRIVVTGGGRFLGRQVVRTPRERGCTGIAVPRKPLYDPTREVVERLDRDVEPRMVVHLVVDAMLAARAEDDQPVGAGAVETDARAV